jgi:hypothetical protein
MMKRVRLVVALALWTLPFQAALADAGGAPSDKLRTYINHSLGDSNDIRFRTAETDLNGDGADEVVVYVTSPDYCGSGGCVTLVLEKAGAAYRTVMRATVTRLPIRVLASRHHGWKDIGVMVGGGGVSPYEAGMAFNGRRYPSNPTTPPARRLAHPAGMILIGQP